MAKLTTFFLIVLICTSCANKASDKTCIDAKNDSLTTEIIDTTNITIQENVCIDYSESKFNDSVNDYSYDYSEYAQKDEQYRKNKTLLTKDFVKRFLFYSADSIPFIDIIGDTIGKISTNDHITAYDFYLIKDTLFKTDNFLGRLYEEIDSDGFMIF